MVNFCAVFGCSNRSNREKGKSFFRLPKVACNQGDDGKILSKERRQKWINAINRVGNYPDILHTRICSDHFITGKPASLFSQNDPDWVPSLNMGHNKFKFEVEKPRERYLRHKNRSLLTSQNDSMSCINSITNLNPPEDSIVDFQIENFKSSDSIVSESVIIDCQNLVDASVQTDMTVKNINQIETEFIYKNKLNYDLRANLVKLHVGTIEWFDTDSKVTFYTGLPNLKILCCLFNFLKPLITENENSVLSYFEEFSLTLMRLRLNLSIRDLAYRFETSKSTSSKVFLRWIDIMYFRMKHLIKWPARNELIETMPLCFRKYFETKVAVIIDCFEIFINKPSNLCARAATWSQYKHHNTVKFLIGVSPQGVITFVSKAWGGRVSDKYLTEHCSILKNILPGDVILADRGFNIAESVGFYCGELKIPGFTKGKLQLTCSDVETTRKIASVRVHVERVIGLLRNKYKVLQSIMPLDYLYTKDSGLCTIDKIVIVCSSLINICDSIIPVE
nr:uncharacterized protein LOC101235303 [Hydra vulgaris]